MSKETRKENRRRAYRQIVGRAFAPRIGAVMGMGPVYQPVIIWGDPVFLPKRSEQIKRKRLDAHRERCGRKK